jgi:hypothetical protein
VIGVVFWLAVIRISACGVTLTRMLRRVRAHFLGHPRRLSLLYLVLSSALFLGTSAILAYAFLWMISRRMVAEGTYLAVLGSCMWAWILLGHLIRERLPVSLSRYCSFLPIWMAHARFVLRRDDHHSASRGR